MIKLKYYLQKVGKGFDPVPDAYAKEYADEEYRNFNTRLVDKLASDVDSFKDKTLIDLGGGPGHYSLEFARRGAKVTWHDISQNYLKIAKTKAEKQHLNVNFSLGYLDDANGKYDILFNRICWCYCINDYRFAETVYSLVKNGGYGYIIINNEGFLFNELKKTTLIKSIIIRTSYWVNESFNFKLTHIHPSHRKLEKIFSNFQFRDFQIQRKGNNTLITFRK